MKLQRKGKKMTIAIRFPNEEDPRKICELAEAERTTPSSFCRELLMMAIALEFGEGGDSLGLSMDKFVQNIVDVCEESEDPSVSYKNFLEILKMEFKKAYQKRTGEKLL